MRKDRQTLQEKSDYLPNLSADRAFIAAQGAHSWRPAHLHLIVSEGGKAPCFTSETETQRSKLNSFSLPPREDGRNYVTYDFILDPA